MEMVIKTIISLIVILTCTYIGKKVPTLAGLIATMPLTALIVLCWLYMDNPRQRDIVASYSKGAAFGVLPSLFFSLSAMFCFKKGWPLSVTMAISFIVWFLGAIIHQSVLR